MKSRIISVFLIIIVTLLCIADAAYFSAHDDGSDDYSRYTGNERWYIAEHNPLSPYPKTVTYTLGKLSGTANSYMPKGDTYENNAYTRYLKKKLNVQNKDVFETAGDHSYDERVSMAVASGKLPDIFIVDSEEMLRKLVESDQICDLTDVYDECASPHIKNVYNSYGSEIMERVTFDGRMYALPETNIDNGPPLLWLRYDWLKRLNLDPPKTVTDLRKIISEFMKKDPGNNGEGKTTGLVCVPELVGASGYSQEYTADAIFNAFGAYPDHWIKKDGEWVYGSVQPEVKKALAFLRQMYSDGTLDKNLLFRTTENLTDLVVNGQCGAFFGPWWAPNNPLMQAVAKNQEADWRPFLLETGKDGSTSFASQNPTSKYLVVRKGYKRPEVAIKVISALFDYMPYGDETTTEMEQYYVDNVDPTARPFSINVDYKNALSSCFEHLSTVLSASKSESDLDLLEGAYLKACQAYLNEKDTTKVSPENWAAYTSRITACHKISDGDIHEITAKYFSETDTQKKVGWKLSELEQKAFIEIVTGDAPLSEFDDFVKEWNTGGGYRITTEVRNLDE